MIPLKVSSVINAVKGERVSGSEEEVIHSVSLDSRSLDEHDFFIPLTGEHFDGHRFIKDALKKGACGFIAERLDEEITEILKQKKDTVVAIKVADTLKGLQDLAREVRKKLDIQSIGITGSTGKTCTKDMLKSILSQKMRVVANKKNYNNEIGVPLTIFEADENTDVIIAEMAMRGLGQIEGLAQIAMPTLGLVTNIGKTHYELLGSEEAIFNAKSELVKAIPPNGLVVLNSDDSKTPRMKTVTEARVTTFGLKNPAAVSARDINLDALGRPTFEITTSNKLLISVSLPYPGKHNIYNALAATAIALELDVNLKDIKQGLETAVIAEMRMQLFEMAEGITVINDAYNASPASMVAALEVLKSVASNSRKIAVLGDMLELGEISHKSHKELGKTVYQSGVDILITVGENGELIAKGAIESGMDEAKVTSFTDLTKTSKILSQEIKPGDVVLIKASRAMGLEKLLDVLA